MKEEHKLQVSCKQYASLFSNDVLFSAYPSQAKRTAMGYIHMAKEGCISGHADVCLYFNNGLVVFIEFKTLKGKQTDNQKEFEKKVKEFGYEYYLVRTFEEFKIIIDSKINNCHIQIKI